MGFLDYFKPVISWSVEEVREFLDQHSPDDYFLVDVRQPKEYAGGHLPGAVLIPVDCLRERAGELDRARVLITYCASGVRSRAAAAVLANAGFGKVFNMAGGIRAWQGQLAAGTPEAVRSWFLRARTAEEHVALSWLLEEGTRGFYQELSARFKEHGCATALREMAAAEDAHLAMLQALYEGISGKPLPADYPRGVFDPPQPDGMMEGGMLLGEVLSWAEHRPLKDILELAVALEVNAYDRYLVLRGEVKDEGSRRVFEVISDEERRHLGRLIALFEPLLQAPVTESSSLQ